MRLRVFELEGNTVALRFNRSSRRVAAVIGVLVAVGVLAAVVLFARDRVLLTRVLANVDTHPTSAGKACAAPCRSGRMLLL